MEPPPADHRASDVHKCFMDVVAFVESCAQSPELMQQRLCLLDHVSEDAKPAAVCLAALRYHCANAATRKFHASLLVVICPVSHHRLGFTQRRTGLPADRGDCIHQWDQLRHVMCVGGGRDVGQGDAAGIDDQMMFGACFSAVDGAGACFFPPCTARTEAESTTTREKSIRSAPRSLSSSSRCSCSQTPALRHSFRRFHRVMPQQPISWGKSSHGMPVLSTKRMPVRQTRSGTRGLPTPGTYGCFGRIGSTKAQSSSGTNSLP